MSKPTIGVILAGCGHLDGSEIHEAVLTLLAIDQAGAEAVCMAPDADQAHVVDHLTGKETKETRNVLVESARIARGKIRDIASVGAKELDALVLPGGFGVAKNLSSFAFDGIDMKVHPEVERLVGEAHERGLPIGAICIAPTVIAKLIPGATLTIGSDVATARALEGMGASHAECPVNQAVVDREKRIVTTPAYMLGPWTASVYEGVRRCVDEVVGMIGK